MNILFNTYPFTNRLDATVAQGFKNFGYGVFGYGGIASNYADPHNGEDYDLYIHSGRRFNSPSWVDVPADLKDVPKIFLWGHDSGMGREYREFPNLDDPRFQAFFIRDLRRNDRNNVFPIFHGIEDRYYSSKPLPISERPIDVLFKGKQQGQVYGHRGRLLTVLQEELGQEYNLVFERHTVEGGWNVHCEEYYKLLSQAKIILSLSGGTFDCPRHWESLASKGIALIQWMPTVHPEPWLVHGRDYFRFVNEIDCPTIIREILSESTEYQQSIADSGFKTGQEFHTTKARARYILECLKGLEL